MKKVISLCAACLLVLTGCGGDTEPSASLPVSAPVPPPSATELATPSAPVVITPEPVVEVTPPPVETVVPPTESLTPTVTIPPSDEPDEAWDGDPAKLTLNDFPTQMVSGAGDIAAQEGGLSLIAQLPEQDTWLYGYYGSQQEQRLILRLGTVWQSFDLTYLSAEPQLPLMAYGDFDSDMDLELAVLLQTSPDLWDLHVIEIGGGLWTDHWFKPSDYQAILEQSVLTTMDAEARTVTFQLGEQSYAYPLPEGVMDHEGPIAFTQSVTFTVEGDSILASFSANQDYGARIDATVVHTGSAFGLTDLTLAPVG